MKRCFKCKLEKELCAFSKNRRTKDGFQDGCKECMNAANRATYAANPEKKSASQRVWRDTNRQAVNEAAKAWRVANPEKAAASTKKWRVANPEKVKACRREWYALNIEEQRDKARAARAKDPAQANQAAKEWRASNPDKVKDYARWWRKQNKPENAARQGKRRAAKLQRTPNWLTFEDFEKIEGEYAAANALSVLTGIDFVVDHVLPLQGYLVSGLHVPQNLQVLSASENSRKGNRWFPE